MSEDIWVNLWKIIRAVTPRCRVEMANAGEPTLHPDMLNYLRIARRLSPDSQIQITTNGTMLSSGKMAHAQLSRAGANIVYVDMYAPKEKHIKLAEESGIPFYEYYSKPANAPGAWTYHGPETRLIVLMEQPANWPDKRKKLGRLGTMLNHLDWEAAKPFGLTPVEAPLRRRCSQPFKYVSVHCDGSYELCCQDFFGETAGKLGNVSEGVEGFKKFWFGEMMQRTRRGLHLAPELGRPAPYCSRCGITFSKCDFKMWPDGALEHYYDGSGWIKIDGGIREG